MVSCGQKTGCRNCHVPQSRECHESPGCPPTTLFETSGGPSSLVHTTVFVLENEIDRSAVHVLIRVAITIVLFTGFSFEKVYLRANPDISIRSGLPPFNVSLAIPEKSVILSMFFTMSVKRLLSDTRTSVSFPPTTHGCKDSGSLCFSYVLPGEYEQISLQSNDSMGPIDFGRDNEEGATTFVSEDAPGYQLEYVQTNYPFNSSDCRIFQSFAALKICVANDGNDLMAGKEYPFTS